MPLGPRIAACVRPAPKSRFVLSGSLRIKIKINGSGSGSGNGNGNGNATATANTVSVAVRPGGVPFVGGSGLMYVTAGVPGCLGGKFRV
jgi:hypothetical protein